MPGCFEWSKQVLEHRPSFQLVHHVFAENLPALKAIITQFLDCGKDPDMVETAASPFNKINNVDMTTPNRLSGALAHVDHEKGLWGILIDIARWLWEGAKYGRPSKGIATRLGRLRRQTRG